MVSRGRRPRKTDDYGEDMDELDYAIRFHMMQDASQETVTLGTIRASELFPSASTVLSSQGPVSVVPASIGTASEFVTEKEVEIARAMGAKEVTPFPELAKLRRNALPDDACSRRCDHGHFPRPFGS